MLASRVDMHVVGDASDLAAAALLVNALDVDVVLVTGSAAVEDTALLDRLRTARPGVQMVALLASSSTHSVRAALAAGMKGCLSRECSSEDLIACLRVVAKGEQYLGPHLKKSLMHSLVASDPAVRRPLAPREREVLTCIASGLSTKEIASRLGIGTKSVETHRRRVTQKLNRKTIAELTQYAMLHGLIDAHESENRRAPLDVQAR